MTGEICLLQTVAVICKTMKLKLFLIVTSAILIACSPKKIVNSSAIPGESVPLTPLKLNVHKKNGTSTFYFGATKDFAIQKSDYNKLVYTTGKTQKPRVGL